RVVSDADQKKIKTQDSKIKTILLTPQGQVFNQKKAQKLTDNMINKTFDLLLVCGHYEGFDERIRNYVDEEISIGDYILTGGELAAAVIVDSVARLIPGVLGKAESHQEESFSVNLNDSRSIRNSKLETQNSKLKIRNYLEYPHYTRPVEFDGLGVPEVLKSGNHQEIKKWRQEESIKKTKKRRPELL
ncbi:MAG: hypothetical protein PHT36_00820, partial [Patescibacteria group bacterium]|nr:hypothetical protein [Patescibacteria group bacterium]